MSQREEVFSLNYRKAKITSIPKEVLNYKDTLLELDISGNDFTDFYSVLEDLKQLTNLKKLKINIYTQEQAKILIDSLPNLEYLNDEPIDDEDIDSEKDNIESYNEEELENKDTNQGIILNNSLIKEVDNMLEPIFQKLQDFYNMNKKIEYDFKQIMEDFNNLGIKLNISKNNDIENLTMHEISKKIELYKLLFNKLNKIKNVIHSNKYNHNSIQLLRYILEQNEKIKNKCNKLLLLNPQCESYDKTNANTYNNTNNIRSSKSSINNNYQKKNSFKYNYQQKHKSLKEDKNNSNKSIQKSNNKKISNKYPLQFDEQNSKKNIYTPKANKTKKNSNEILKKNKSYNKSNKLKFPIHSGRKSLNHSSYSENKNALSRNYYSNKNFKKYSKQVSLIENYKDQNIKNLLIKQKPIFDLNIFDDDNNDLIYKDKLNIRIINLNNLLEIINQVYKIRNNRIEKIKQGVYNKGTLEQDLYTYLKSKYGLKKLIIEWNIIILSSIQKYYKINSEVYLFCLILRNELDEDSIIIISKIKRTVSNILNLIYDYDIKMIESIKQNKVFLKENEWKTICKCLYIDDNNLKEKCIDKVSTFLSQLIKGQDLIAKTGRKILFSDFMNILINFNIKLRKNYLHNLFLLFTEQDTKRTGIISLEGFANIIKDSQIINNEEKMKEVIEDLIEIADKEGSGQITFTDAVQCLDKLYLITDEGKIKFLDELSELIFN